MIGDDVRKCSILLVDDEVNLRQTFELFLQKAGYRSVVGAGSIAEAMGALAGREFDLIISDIVLDGGTGIDILRQVRQSGNECPVVMITGYPNVETAAEAVRLGAVDYLPKPVKKDDLLAVTETALKKELARKAENRCVERREADTKRHEAILGKMLEMILTVDRAGKVVGLNELARVWCAANLPELERGWLLRGGQHPVSRSMAEDCQTVLDGLEVSGERCIEWQRPSGQTGVLCFSVSPLIDDRGTVQGVVVSARDVTRARVCAEKECSSLHGLIGSSEPMRRLYALVHDIGPVDTTVLITGESGTGKNVAAMALHRESLRAGRPLVKVDCASIPEDVLESELFGHRRGAFTGADTDRLGRILQAEGGTLFLDEIGEISQKMQLRLLRFLQERSFYPVGRDLPVRVDVRVIAATNVNLEKKVAAGSFREDLYYRLRVVDVVMPPLRQRKEDIPALVEYFVSRLSSRMGLEPVMVTDEAMQVMLSYHWQGNVRELEHVIERALVLCNNGAIDVEHLPEDVSQPSPYPEYEKIMESSAESLSSPPVDDEVERIIIALRQAGGNKAKAARILGVDRSTIYRKMQTYDIDAESCAAGSFHGRSSVLAALHHSSPLVRPS